MPNNFPSPYFRTEYGRIVDVVRNGKKKSARLPEPYILGPGVYIKFQPFHWYTGYGKILIGLVTDLQVGKSGKLTSTITDQPYSNEHLVIRDVPKPTS